jgi:hypothetical protein
MNQKKILALGAALTGALSFYACSSSSSSSGPESNYDYEFSSWEQALTTACTAGQTALLKGGNEDGSDAALVCEETILGLTWNLATTPASSSGTAGEATLDTIETSDPVFDGTYKCSAANKCSHLYVSSADGYWECQQDDDGSYSWSWAYLGYSIVSKCGFSSEEASSSSEEVLLSSSSEETPLSSSESLDQSSSSEEAAEESSSSEAESACESVGQCDAMVKSDVTTWHFVVKDDFGNDASYVYSSDGSTLSLTITYSDGTTSNQSFSYYDMSKEIGVEMGYSAAKSTCTSHDGNETQVCQE